jgi:hypothetical protein
MLDALGMTQTEAAAACQLDQAGISRMVHGTVRPDKERAMQMAACIDTAARHRGVPHAVRRDYIVGWLISQEYVPRTLRAAGRRLMVMLSTMSSAQQAEALRRLRPYLQEVGASSHLAAWVEQDEEVEA